MRGAIISFEHQQVVQTGTVASNHTAGTVKAIGDRADGVRRDSARDSGDRGAMDDPRRAAVVSTTNSVKAGSVAKRSL